MSRAFDPDFYQGAIELPELDQNCYLLHALDRHGGDYDVFVNDNYIGSRQTEAQARTHAAAHHARLQNLDQPGVPSADDIRTELAQLEQHVLELRASIGSTTSQPTLAHLQQRLDTTLESVRQVQQIWTD